MSDMSGTNHLAAEPGDVIDHSRNANGNYSGFTNVKKKLSSAINIDLSSITSRKSSILEKSSSPKSKKATSSTSSHKKAHQALSADCAENLVPTTFEIQYLGYKELRLPGLGEIVDNAHQIYQNSKSCLKLIKKSLMTISKDGISLNIKDETGRRLLSDSDKPCDSDEQSCFKARRIRYCGVDKKHQKVFVFNYQYGKSVNNVRLHVVLCKHKEDARHIAKYLSQIFKNIQTDWHKMEKEEMRNHAIEMNKLIMRSTSMTGQLNSSSATSPTTSLRSKEGSLSGMSSSGEWVPGTFISQLSVS